MKLIAEIDEFKGRWELLSTLSPDHLGALRRVATIESVGQSTRIEGARFTDAEVETLLSGLQPQSFATRDEQEVAGYAEAMGLVFEAFGDLRLTENLFVSCTAPCCATAARTSAIAIPTRRSPTN